MTVNDMESANCPHPFYGQFEVNTTNSKLEVPSKPKTSTSYLSKFMILSRDTRTASRIDRGIIFSEDPDSTITCLNSTSLIVLVTYRGLL